MAGGHHWPVSTSGPGGTGSSSRTTPSPPDGSAMWRTHPCRAGTEATRIRPEQMRPAGRTAAGRVMPAVPAYSETGEPDTLAPGRSSRASCGAGPFRDAGLARPESQPGAAGGKARAGLLVQGLGYGADQVVAHVVQPGDLIAVVHRRAASCLLRRHEEPPALSFYWVARPSTRPTALKHIRPSRRALYRAQVD